MKIMKMIIGAFALLMTSSVFAATLNLNWDSPTARTDNTIMPVDEIATFRIQYGTVSGQYSSTVDINDGTATSASITFLPGGTYYVIVTVIDTFGASSVVSPESSITLPTAPPKPVTNLQLSVGAF